MPKIADIEDTPNPNAVKFVLKDRLTWGTAHSFNSADAAASDDECVIHSVVVHFAAPIAPMDVGKLPPLVRGGPSH